MSTDDDFETQLAALRPVLKLLEEVWPPGETQAITAALNVLGEIEAGRSVRLGRYVLERELGGGGFGVVFLGFDTFLRRHVAVKVPRGEVFLTPAVRKRFVREARAAGQLDHPNIVPVLDAQEDGPMCYLAYAYCPGPNLAQWLANNKARVPPRDAARLIETLAEAMAHAHHRGIVHRDLKPSNVLLVSSQGSVVSSGGQESGDRGQESGDRDQAPGDAADLELSAYVPKIADFGLAMMADDAEITRTGTVLGTAAYMAPEQAAGQRDRVGPASDVFSLGVMLYELLAGRRPFQGETPLAVLEAMRSGEAAGLWRFDRRIPRDLETICLKCLQERVEDRYPSGAELAEDLRLFRCGDAIKARRVSLGKRAIRWARRRPRVAAFGIPLVSVALILTANHFTQLAHERPSDLTTSLPGPDTEKDSLRQLRSRYLEDLAACTVLLQNRQMQQARAALMSWSPERYKDLVGFEWYALEAQVQRPYSVAQCYTPAAAVDDEASYAHSVFAWSTDWQRAAWNDGADQNTLLIGNSSGGTWEVIDRIPLQERPLSIAFIPGSHDLLISTATKGVRIWKSGLRDGEAVIPMPVRGLVFSANGRWLAGAVDNTCFVWDFPGCRLHTQIDHRSKACAPVFSPVDNRIATAGVNDGELVVVPVNNLAQRIRISTELPVIDSLAFSPDGWTLAYGGSRFETWRFDTNIQSRGFEVRPNPNTSYIAPTLQFHTNGRAVFVTGRSGWISLIDLETKETVHEEETFGDLQRVHATDTANIFLLQFTSGLALRRSYPCPDSPEIVETGADRNYCMTFLGNSRIAIGSQTGISIWDTRTRELLDNTRNDDAVFAAACSPDGEWLAYGDDGGQIHLRNLATGNSKILQVGARISSLAFSRDSKMLVSGAWDAQWRLWDIASGVQLRSGYHGDDRIRHNRKIAGVALHPDGEQLATVNHGEIVVRVWDFKTGREHDLIGEVEMRGVVWSPNGETIVAVNYDGRLFFYDPHISQPRKVLEGAGGSSRIAFHPDGKILASCHGHEGNALIRLWDVGLGKEMISLRTFGDELRAVAWSPDGKTLAATGHDGKVYLWSAR